jgi:hypothetical protein
MILADFIAIGAVLLFTLIGAGIGFGRYLDILTRGIIGKIISVIVCYFLFGIVLDWGFVQDLLSKFVGYLQSNDNFICNILLKIRIDLIVFAIVLFIVVQILRKIATALVCNIFEIDFFAIRLVNKLLGVVLSLATLVILALIVLQLLTYGGAETVQNITNSLSGSAFGLDKLFVENPLNSILHSINLGNQ